MTVANILMMAAIVVYLVLVVIIGIQCSKKNSTVDDFYLGGRKLGPFVTAMSAEASDMSSWLLMGLPGVAYLSGLADAGWTAIGLAVGTYVNWLIVAKRMRRYTSVTKSITIPDFFSDRYHDDKHILMAIAAVIIIIFFIPYTASGFAACGKLFNSLFGANYMIAMMISAAVIVVYTTLGGFLAASTTDFLQGVIMSIALLIVFGYGIYRCGGLDVVFANAAELPGYLSMTLSHDATTGGASTYGLITIVSTLAWGLGYFGMPHILLRFMAIEDENKLKLSRRVACIWVVISLTIGVLIGVVGLSMSKLGIVDTLEGSASETIIVRIAEVFSHHGAISAIIAGLILAGILASTMSTADSQLLAASSSVSHNLCKGVFGIELSEKVSLIVARGSVVVISIIAAFIASDPNSSVFSIVSFAWAGFGAAFGPVVLSALFWKRSNKWGALAGMISGGAMVFIWKYLVRPLGGAFDIYELLPAFVVAAIAIIVVSLLTQAPSEEIIKEFNEVAEK